MKDEDHDIGPENASGSDMLTKAELESLDRAAKEISDYGRKAFAHLNRQTKLE